MSAVWTSKIPLVATGMEDKARAAVAMTIATIDASAKGQAPVDTGMLRNSIQHQMTGPTAGEVTTGVEYAIYQEYGTYKMAAQPFMVPAAEQAAPAFQAAMQQIV